MTAHDALDLVTMALSRLTLFGFAWALLWGFLLYIRRETR